MRVGEICVDLAVEVTTEWPYDTRAEHEEIDDQP